MTQEKSTEIVTSEPKEKNKVGRPTIYSDDLALRILSRLSEGESLAKICATDDIPARSTIYEWCFYNKDFSDRYTKAKEMQIDNKLDSMLDRIDEIAEKYFYFDEHGNKKIDGNGVAIERLYQDSLKWCAVKLMPKKYGDRAGEDDKKDNKTINVNIYKGDNPDIEA